MTAHTGEPSRYYKHKNIWPLSRSCSAYGDEHQGLTLSEASCDRASAGATSVGCSSLWLSCPWDKLPQVREIAHDFYDNLPYHRSWPEVLYQFITTPSVSSFNRVKRPDVKNLATTTVVGQKNKSR